jgi:zinc transporter 1/2/3
MNLLYLKVLDIFIILIFSTIGAYLPIYFNGKIEPIVHLLAKLFSAGIILGTGFIHMLPDSHEMFNKAYPNVIYPFTEMITGVSCICLMAVEEIVNKYFHKSKEDNKNVHAYTNINSHDIELANNNDHHNHHNHSQNINSYQNQSKYIDNTNHHCHTINIVYQTDPNLKLLITLYILEIGMAIHSMIIGITLGTTTSQSTLTTLSIAIIIHQLFEGIALGSSILKANIDSMLKIFTIILIYSITTPIGIFIGIGIKESESNNIILIQ